MGLRLSGLNGAVPGLVLWRSTKGLDAVLDRIKKRPMKAYLLGSSQMNHKEAVPENGAV